MNKEQFINLGLTEDQAIKAEIESKKELETYVPKTRFDEVNTQKKELEKTVKDRDGQLNDLKSKTGDNEDFKKQIETLQADNKKKDEDYQAQLKDLQISNAIKIAITDKAQDVDLVAGLFDKSKLILNNDGNITGLEEQLKYLRENKAFLFRQETPGGTGIIDGGITDLGGDKNGNLSLGARLAKERAESAKVTESQTNFFS